MIQRVCALIAAAWTEPAARGFARGRGNGIANLPNHRTFLLGRILSHSDVVGHAVAEPLPLSFIAFLDDRRMMRAHVGVKQHRRADAVFVLAKNMPSTSALTKLVALSRFAS